MKTIKLHAERLPGYLSNTMSYPEDVPGHVLAQRVFLLHVTSNEPDFNGFNTMNYVQADEIDGTGSFRGYATWPLTNGDFVYIKFQSNTQKTITDNGDWKIDFNGELTFLTGTGKYKDITGSFSYQGVTTENNSCWDAEIKI